MNVFLFVPVGLTLPYAVEMMSALIAKHGKQAKKEMGTSGTNKKSASERGSRGSRYADKTGERSTLVRMSVLNRLAALDGSSIIGRLKIIGFSILFAAAFSFCIEFFQALFALGTAEVDDVIMNTMGTAIGCCPFLVRIGGIDVPE